MRRVALIILASASLNVAVVPVASAIDRAPIVDRWNWSGNYIGIAGGGAWGRTRTDVSNGLPGTGSFDLSGGLIGGTIGVNWQMSQWVLGLEGDISWVSLKGSANEIPPFNTATVNNVKENWLATGRLRAGITPTGRWLTYVTGGFAIAGVDVNLSNPNNGVNHTATNTRWGWTVGGGIETALSTNWSVKLEYLYMQFNNPLYSWGPPPPGITLIPSKFPLNEQILRVGINYKFGR